MGSDMVAVTRGWGTPTARHAHVRVSRPLCDVCRHSVHPSRRMDSHNHATVTCQYVGWLGTDNETDMPLHNAGREVWAVARKVARARRSQRVRGQLQPLPEAACLRGLALPRVRPPRAHA